MFATLIRWICQHPYWYTVLAGVPYLMAIFTPATTAIVIVVAWTAARAAMVLPARRWHTQIAEKEAYNNGSADALMVVERRLRL